MPAAAKLVECIADLQLGLITPTEWLQQMAEELQCDAACVISWTTGKPDTAISSFSDHHIKIDPQWLNWADEVIQRAQPEKPAMLEDIVGMAGVTDTTNNSPLLDPGILVAFLDSDPAVTLFIFQLGHLPGGCKEDTRKQIDTLLPALLKAHLVHKKLTSAANIIDMAAHALNGVPRAIVGMTPTGEIVKANDAANEMLDASIFSTEDGQLIIDEPKVMKQLHGKLAEIRILAPESLEQFIWNRSFRCEKEQRNYQLMLRGFTLEQWHLESSSHDRFALLIIGTPDSMLAPPAEHMRDFYDLSNAQARVVVALLEGNDILTSAAKLHISVNTIRSHVRAIYEKLGVDNQRDLLRLLSSTLVDYRGARDAWRPRRS